MPILTIEYPPSLPVPNSGDVKTAERRLLSAIAGLQQARVAQRDYLATQEVSWLLTPAEAATFYAWWKTDLVLGGMWFASDWPHPQGWIVKVRRFLGTPLMSHVPGGNWAVSGLTEVRGASLLPGIGTIYAHWLSNEDVSSPENGLDHVGSPWELSNNQQTVFVPDPTGIGAGTILRQGSVISNLPQSTGKRYFEQIITGITTLPIYGTSPTQFSYGLIRQDFWITGNNALGGTGTWMIGVVGSGNIPTGQYVGDDGAGSITTISPLVVLQPTDVIGFAVDIDARNIWVSINGAWVTGDPSTNTSPVGTNMPVGPYNPCFAAQRGLTGSTLRSIPSQFTYPIPTGFAPWAP